jgi:cytochrome c1
MRRIHHLLVSVAVLYSANFFFLKCNDPEEQKAENVTLEITKNAEDTILINRGKTLFKDTCAICHAVWRTDSYLAGIVERLGTSYLKLYITKQDSLIEAKNEYALKIKKSYGNLASVHNYKFSDEQLNAIMAYLKKYSP